MHAVWRGRLGCNVATIVKRPTQAKVKLWRFQRPTITGHVESLLRLRVASRRGKGAQLIESTKPGSGTRVIATPPYTLDLLQTTRQQQPPYTAARDKWVVRWEPDGRPHALCLTHPDGGVLHPDYDTSLGRALSKAMASHTRAGILHAIPRLPLC